jgi:hypothetical protein
VQIKVLLTLTRLLNSSNDDEEAKLDASRDNSCFAVFADKT